jgi:hypothetical protein
MPSDASIYSMIRPPAQAPGPLDQYAQAMSLSNLMGQSDMQRMQLRGAQRDMESQARLRDLFSKNPNPNATEIAAIDPKYAQTYRTNQIANTKTQGDIDKTQAEILVKKIEAGRERIANIGNDAALAQFREELLRTAGPQAIQGMPASVNDPAFTQWQMTHVQKASDLVDRLKPLYSVQDFGGTKGVVQANPNAMGGVTGLQPKTMSPGERATDARAGATLAETKAEHGRVAERAKVATEAGKWTNDLDRGLQVNSATAETRPITAGGQPIGKKEKGLNDSQSKALLYSNRMEEADSILSDLESQGRTKSTPGSRTGFGVGAAINVLNTEAGQKLDQAKRNFINAVLRRESGAVISPSEFQNAEQQYFPQIGDAPGVMAQKAANRRTAIEGIRVEVPEAHRPVPAPKPDKSVPGSVPTRAEIDAELRRRKVIP